MTWEREMEQAADVSRRNGAPPFRDIWDDGVTAAELDGMDFPPITASCRNAESRGIPKGCGL